ncbi:hypothetical protein BH09MYX1_BH09MYX1_54790 [soil metagenome]
MLGRMDRVLFHAKRVHFAFAAKVGVELRRVHFTLARVDVFVCHEAFVMHHGLVYQSAIRGRLGISRVTMSVIMKRLQNRGFISRRRCTVDRREVIVTITDLGRAAFAEIRGLVDNRAVSNVVDENLFLLDWRAGAKKTRAHLLSCLDVLRMEFRDTSRMLYPP